MYPFRFILIICKKYAGIKKNQKHKNTLVVGEQEKTACSIIIGDTRLKYNLLYIFDISFKNPAFLGKFFLRCKLQVFRKDEER